VSKTKGKKPKVKTPRREKTKEDVVRFLKKQQFLPMELRDFHAQKDLFKAMHDYYAKGFAKLVEEKSNHTMPNWTDGMVYALDFLLYFLAAHGYTLQRSRLPLPFASLQATIDVHREKQANVFKEFMDRRRQEREQANAAAPAVEAETQGKGEE